MCVAQRSRRVERAGPVGDEPLLVREPCQPLLQLGGLDPLGRQRLVQISAGALGLFRQGRHAGHVGAVRVLPLILLTALDPQHEQDDDQDRERDQADEAEQWRETGGRAHRPSWATGAARAEGPAQGALAWLGLPGLGLLEEVELEVAVALAHVWGVNSGSTGATVTVASACKGVSPAVAKPRETVSSALPALPDRELVLDRYRPLRPLGSGASGSVWLARDERTGLDVALKIVPREGKAGYRAEREAEAAARLRHERCLRSYGFGSDPGHVYIAYEYVGGRTLREAMRAGELRNGRAVEAAAQILDGLAHAHGRGIVHRDVKPSNVLLLDEEGVSIRAARLRPGSLRRGRDADRRRRRPRHARLHLARAPAGAGGRAGERRLGRRGRAVGGAGGEAPVLGRAAAADARRDRGGRAAAPTPAARPAQAAARRDRPGARHGAGPAALGSCARGGAPLAAAAPLRHGARGSRRRRCRRCPRWRPTLRPPRGSCRPPWRASLPSPARRCCPSIPAYWPLAIGAGAVALGFVAPRAAVAVALAAPILPLGNLAQGLALLWSALALGWLALVWGDRRGGLAALSGPLLAPLGLIGLVPLAVQPVRGHVRRGAQAAAAVALAAVVAGVRGSAVAVRRRAGPELELAGLESPLRGCRDLARLGAARAPRRARRLRRDRGRDPLRPRRLADRRPWRRHARRDAPRGPGRARAAVRPGRLGDLRLAGRVPVWLCGTSIRLGALGVSTPRSMSVLRSIEQKIEGLFEGMFGRAFRTHVQPVELARKLAKEMDEHRTVSVSRVYVPNEYSSTSPRPTASSSRATRAR